MSSTFKKTNQKKIFTHQKNIKINIINLQNKLTVQPQKIKKLIYDILKKERTKKSGHLNICLVDNSMIKKFNQKYHKTNRATDVLAFNLAKEKGAILADIIISTEMATQQAKTFKTSNDYELLLYLAHGVLHILGYNDQTKRQIKIMRQTENKYVH